MLQDLKQACRELLKNPWFTCVTVLTLALGIGANTAIFGVVNKLLLNPLPYADADRLVYPMLSSQRAGFALPPLSFIAKAWREQAQSLDGMESFNPRSVLAYDANGARVVFGMEMTFGLPGFFGISPVLGRAFTAADAQVGAPAVVMLSYEAWQREHGGATDVLGRVLTLEDKPHVVVGVLPARWESFTRGRHPDLWFPMVAASTSTPGVQAAETIARLRPDVDRNAVRSELDAITARAMGELPQPLFGGEQLTTRLDRPSDRINGSTRDALLVLLAAVGLVLLVACSNVANLLLARSASRARELAVRSALGASVWRLVRALAAECLVLALAAGVAGFVVGWVTLRILVLLRPNTLSALAEVELDVTVLAFTFGVSALTALLFGAGPALQLNSRKVGDALRHGASGVVRGGSAPRLRKLLVAAQMAMSVVLLVGAGLLVRSFIHLQNVDVGFDTQNLFTAQLTLPQARYRETASREALSEQLAERVRVSPGVAAVTESLLGPAASLTMAGPAFEVRGRTLAEADARAPRSFNSVRPNYFAAVGIRLVEGRTFTADETRAGGVLLVNEAAARHYWPDGGALGGEVKWTPAGWSTVIGITSNVISGGPTRSRDEPKFYLPFKHEARPPGAVPGIVLTVRAAGDAAVAIASVRAATRELDPEIAITNVLMTETAFADSIQGPRFNMALLTAFAVIALVLAAVGLAAVIGYEVTERTHEIGIRMALGARRENVRRLAMRHGLGPAFVGVSLGVVGAFGATQLVATMLYGIAPRDPVTFVGVVTLLLLVALGASWLPARRATLVDPIAALRAD